MITIRYDFREREAEDLEKINAILRTMKLWNLEIEDFQGYLATTRDGDGNLLGKRYGLDSGQLICEEASGKQAGHIYQIDTVVVDDIAGVEGEEYLDIWRQTHPQRIIRIVFTIGFSDCKAYTIVHHEKGTILKGENDGPKE